MTPHDALPNTDEVGCPDDGRVQAPPVTFTEPNGYAVTREPAYVQAFDRPSPLIDFQPEEPR